MPATLDVSVVICAYTEERWNDLNSAIDSIHSQAVPAREVIVVVDHSPHLFRATRAARKDVTVVRNRECRGLAGARNSGASVASGDVIAFLDDDAVAPPDWLNHLQHGFHDPAVLGVGGVVEPLWLDGRPRWFPEEFDWVVGCTFRGMPTRRVPSARLVGANMSFRRDVYHGLGGFRTGLGRVGTRPVAGEETEFCIRAILNWPHRYFLFDPDAKVYHRVPRKRASWSYFTMRCYGEGLSKAMVSRSVGANVGLSSERSYTFRTLPRGVARGVRDGIWHRDSYGLARAGVILAGLTITTTGFVRGTVLSRSSSEAHPVTAEAGLQGGSR